MIDAPIPTRARNASGSYKFIISFSIFFSFVSSLLLSVFISWLLSYRYLLSYYLFLYSFLSSLLLLFFCLIILCLYLLQTHFGIFSFSHPDNALEVCGLLTPLHIVPEWYFLCQYAMLKAVPNKNAGFIILLTSIFSLFFFGEIRNLTTLCLLNN